MTTLAITSGRLVGRAAELDRLRDQFEFGTRLVTLWGPGGIGKTCLATHFAKSETNAWFCDLSDASDADGVLSSVARGFDIALSPGTFTQEAARLGRVLAARGRVFVILDNFEQVAAHAATTVGRWLSAAPDARFLVTSREKLRLKEEVSFELPPLSLPEPGGDAELT